MKKKLFRNLIFIAVFAFLAPVALKAQKDEMGEKGDKGKTEKQHIIITTKGDKKDKVVVEINGDNITVNGKPIEEYKDKNGDISVNISKLKDLESLSYFKSPGGDVWHFSQGDGLRVFSGNENRAMLGVTTEKVEGGVEIQSITEGSAAEKAGLKENDIIKKIDDQKIESPEDLSQVIRKHKPGDIVTITYLRDKKELKTTAELTKWKGVGAFSFTPGQNFKFNMGELNNLFKAHPVPDVNAPFNQFRSFHWSGGSPKLGLSVQDTDDGKGVKVIGVDEESNAARAGIKENDIITHVDEKAVNSVDEISKLVLEKKDNLTVRFQLTRNGKSQNIEVKMPRKIKTTNL
jgi:serine protease Do